MPLLFSSNRRKFNWLLLLRIVCFSFITCVEMAPSVTCLIDVFLHFIVIASFYCYCWLHEDNEDPNLSPVHLVVPLLFLINTFVIIITLKTCSAVACFIIIILIFCYWFEIVLCGCIIYYYCLHFLLSVWNYTF